MQIRIAEHSGYCFGVSRAIRIVDRIAAAPHGSVFTVGELIHNPRVVAGLEKQGILSLTMPSLDLAAGSSVIIPTHGSTPDAVRSLERLGAIIIDATCPHVMAVQERIRLALAARRFVIIAGDPGHAEVLSYAGISPKHIAIVSTPGEALKAGARRRAIFLAAQTTFSSGDFTLIRDALKSEHADVDVFHSLCAHTLKAQQAVRALGVKCDKMIVVGGRNSSNTLRLKEVSEETGTKTFHVEKASELRKRSFSDADSVCIAAGASTPPDHIREIIDWLSRRFGVEEI